MNVETSRLDVLFPFPSPPPSSLSPARLPGASHQSGLALTKALKDDYKRWHVFFNDKGFHNHAAHHLLAIYQLGAIDTLLEAAYQTHVSYMRPAYESPEPITTENFDEHLADENFYNSYLQFFSSILLDKGTRATIEEYIFSPRVNISIPGSRKEPMLMLNRFLGGLLHPLIHTGYGAEFGLLGMVAEGLAQTAVHPPAAPVLIPDSLFDYALTASADTVKDSVSQITALMPSLVLDKAREKFATNDHSRQRSNVHAITILAQVLHNRDFDKSAIGLPPAENDDVTAFKLVVEKRGERLLALTESWSVDGTNAEEVASKIEELVWMNVLIYGVGGWGGRKYTPNGDFNGDFLLMHLVTSVLFLHSLTAYLSATSISILLRTYLTNCLVWWVARGRPALPIAEFYAAVSSHPTEHGAPHTSPAKDTLIPEEASPNSWLPILQTTLAHPDEHLCKLQRALAHFGSLYGSTPAGHFAHLAEVSGAPLEGAESLDGSLFLRVAGLTANRLGWMREGQERKGWDFKGFFD